MAVTLTPIIGMPPLLLDNDFGQNDTMFDCMPIATIKPMTQKFQAGLATMVLDPTSTSKYTKILSAHGYNLGSSDGLLKLAFLADSFPTDTFSNTYQESSISDMMTSVSKGASTFMQSIGAHDLKEAIAKSTGAGKELAGALKDAGVSGMGMVQSGFDKFQELANKAGDFKNAHLKSELANNILKTASTVASGARVDFPQIWADSSFNPSYTMTVRLYNPFPADEEATDKYIIGPIAAMMLLGIPLSESGTSTYNYPFLHEITCKGVYFVNPCYISNITVIKGGDQQQIAFNQRMGIVDVRIDFGSLYSSILAAEDGGGPKNRPTLRNYIDTMKKEKPLIFDDSMYDHEVSEEDAKNKRDRFPWWDDANHNGIIDLGEDTGDPDPDKTFQMFVGYITLYGSLETAIAQGASIPQANAVDLYNNNYITLADLLTVYPNAPIDDQMVP